MTIQVFCILLLSLLCLIISFFLSKRTKQINTRIDEENEKLEKRNQQLNKIKESFERDLDDIQQNLNRVNETLKTREQEVESKDKVIQRKTNEIADLYKKAEETAAVESKLQKDAFLNYCEILEREYQKRDAEFEEHIIGLNNEIAKTTKELDQISATRAAARLALQKEQEVKDNKDNYRLIVTENDLDDIHRLERVKKELHKPRILSMLIWQTYWQPIAKRKFPEILQAKTKTGIYKITNTETNECYIGQSLDIYKRWNDHCKCGLGIDTPPGNKLYKAIQDFGLENFTFELLAECPQNELNEKERYFINLYESDTYGYNGNIGVSK